MGGTNTVLEPTGVPVTGTPSISLELGPSRKGGPF